MKKMFIFFFFIYSIDIFGQNSIQITTATPATTCSGASLLVTFNSTGTFTNSNFIIKLKKIESCYFTSTTTVVTTYNASTSPSSITIPNTPPTTNNTGSGCSTMSGYFPASRSYRLNIVNGLDSSAEYTLNILPSCGSIQTVSSISNCIGTNTLTAYFTTLGISTGNVFTAELSDLGGTTFPVSPVVVGSVSSNTATTMPITLPTGTIEGNYKIKIKSSNPVGENTGTLTVIGIPTGLPTLTKNPTAATAGGTNLTLTASDCPSGNWVLWSTGSQNNSIVVAPYTSTTYTATCKNNCGQAPTAASIQVEVVAPPVITADKYNFCPSGSSVIFTATGCTSPDLVTWFNGSNGTSLGTGLTYSSNVTSLSYFAAKCTREGVQSGYSNQISISQASVPPAPSSITKSPNTTVGTVGPYNTVTMTVATGGYGVKWENGSTANPRQVSPGSTTTYTVKNLSNGCESASGLSSTVTVDPNLPIGITISSAPNVDYTTNGNIKLCASENINLSSDGCSSPGIVKWYRKWYNSTPVQIGTGITLTTNNNATADVDGRLFYYQATCTNGASVSPYSNEVSVGLFNNWIPNGIIATPSGSVNPGTSVSLATNGSCGNSTTVKWDDNSTASTRIVVPNTTTTYSFRCVNGACESTATSINVTVVCPAIYAPSLSATQTNIGLGESTTLSSYCATGSTIKWDDNTTTSSRIVTPTTSSTIYSAKCVNNLYNTCESSITSITISAGTRPSSPTITGPSAVCAGGNITLMPVGCPANSSIYWYRNNETSSFNSSYNNNPLIVQPTSTTIYYARCKVNLLESLNSNSISVTMINLPSLAANITATLTTPGTATVSLSAVCTAGAVSWYSKSPTNFQVYPYTAVETLVGAGSPVSLNLEPNAAYLVRCNDPNSTCFSTTKVDITNTLTGTSVSYIDGAYTFGSFVGTGNSYYNGDQIIDFSPSNMDTGTSYFSKGVVYNSYYSGISSSIQTIQRKNNNWEISNYDARLGGYVASMAVQYRTKYKYSSKLPPCTTVWIKDTDASEVTITVGSFCENAVPLPCASSLTLASVNESPIPTDDISSGTITKQASAASGSITATNKITGTAKVTYQAKNIELNAGFKADNGTVFKAEIGGCN